MPLSGRHYALCFHAAIREALQTFVPRTSGSGAIDPWKFPLIGFHQPPTLWKHPFPALSVIAVAKMIPCKKGKVNKYAVFFLFLLTYQCGKCRT